VLLALTAFGFWGFVPIYFKAVQDVSPLEVLAHRIIWSVPLTAGLILLGRGFHGLRQTFSSGKVLLTLLLSATLVACNWFVFIYAVSTDRVLQASLGYYINPLVNVLLGVVLLRERLRVLQITAVMLAAAGTATLTINYGRLPWIALVLGFSFGFYGLIRKTIPIESLNGLFAETTLISPLALAYLAWMGAKGGIAFGSAGWQPTTLLFLAGAVTTFPLLCFTSAARRLRYSTVGLLQYVAPTLNFLLAVYWYDEPFSLVNLVAFTLIWIGLAIFMFDSLYLQWRLK
jgi:chloramphenicol-sensitive protein RarD